LATKLGSGDLGAEHVDAIAAASAKSGGDAAKDQKLIAEVGESKPDDAHKVTQRWLERREQDGAQSRYDQQRERRKATKGRSVTSGCSTIELHGTDEAQAEMWAKIETRANEMYQADGGRDVADADHPRTHMQRMFDAAYELITNTPAAGRVSHTSGEQGGDHRGDGGRDAPVSTRSASPKSMLHVTLTVDDEAAEQIRAVCPTGEGYLPASVLERYACGAMIGGTVFSQKGEVLWFGRKRRYASPAQFAALVARDGGCVLCGAPASRCHAHHLMPFNAPCEGKTNIDELALLCTSCHTWVYDEKRTLYFESASSGTTNSGDSSTSGSRASPRGSPPTLIWRTRPATAQEIAPKRKPIPNPSQIPLAEKHRGADSSK